MFQGMDIIAVEPGTEIECGDEKLVVTEANAVTKGRKIYMTAPHVAALNAHPSVKRAVQKQRDVNLNWRSHEDH